MIFVVLLLLVILNIHPLENLALNKLATNSSQEESGLHLPVYAFDGKSNTRWASIEKSDPQWLMVNLGSAKSFGLVVLRWENYGKVYEIQTSNNNIDWTTTVTVTDGNGGVEIHWFSETTARYVRMYGTERGTTYGYSLYEFEIYPVSDRRIYVSDQNNPSNSKDCGRLEKPCKSVGYSYNTHSPQIEEFSINIYIYKTVTDGKNTENSMDINVNDVKFYGIENGGSGYVFCLILFLFF
jgi:hypothetical protein